jgi:deoxyadenosine/deoxycytidine kinase
MYIAVAGNIGAGKTTLTRHLAEIFGWKPAFEHADNNPYLEDFYNDMPRWAFNLQVYFLNSRFSQVVGLQNFEGTVIQDRSIYEDAHIFAQNLVNNGFMPDRDYQNYLTLFHSMNRFIPPPTLMIYLRADLDNLLRKIKKRNRPYEQNLPVAYLEQLNELYENWINGYQESKLLVLDTNEYDFVENPEHLQDIAKAVKQALDQ